MTSLKASQDNAIKESEQRFQLVADSAPVLIWMSDTNKLCTYFNKPWLQFTGRSIEQELGNGWAEGVHPDDFQRCLDIYTQSFDRRDEFRMEYRLRRHDGEYRWIFDSGVPRYSSDGSFAGYIGSCVDVTELKRAEGAIRESEARYRRIVETTNEGVWLLDSRLRTVYVNRQMAKMLKYEPEEMIGQSVFSFYFQEDLPHKRDVLTRRQQGLGEQLEERYRRKDGSELWVQMSATPVFKDNGEFDGALGMMSDITDRKLAEEAVSDMTRKLVEAQEQERSRIGRELHDDVSQRLAMLSIELGQLRDKNNLLPEFRDRLQKLKEMATDITMGVHDLSHELHSATMEYLGPVSAMRSWCEEYGARHKLAIDFKNNEVRKLPQEISLCLLRVLQEALHNATKYSGVKRIEVQLMEETGEVHLTVRDSGKGFDIETARQKRGLGLTSMQERVRLVGGTLVIDSKPLAGTTVHVSVPLLVERYETRSKSTSSG